MALTVFGVTLLAAAAVYIVVMALAVGERGEAFKAFSPGMLSPSADSSRCARTY